MAYPIAAVRRGDPYEGGNGLPARTRTGDVGAILQGSSGQNLDEHP